MGIYTLQSDDRMECDDSSDDAPYSEPVMELASLNPQHSSAALCRVLTATSTTGEYEPSLQQNADHQLQRHETPTPVHYHLYYPADDNNHRSTSSFSSCTWISLSLVAVLAHIFYWYGPSVPPPVSAAEAAAETTSWEEFVSQEAVSLWTLMSRWYAVGHYVCFWCWEALAHEYSALLARESFPSSSLDCHPPAVWDPTILKSQIVGQSIAVDKLSRILNQEWDQQYPMIFYTIGGTAVGKQHLAHVIARQFTGSDCKVDDGSHSDSLLSLTNLLTIDNEPTLTEAHREEDDDGEEEGNNNTIITVYQQVLDHATTHPTGSVIVWPLADRGDSGQVNDLVMPVLDRIHAAPAGIFEKSILVLTSSIGNPTLNKALRKYGRDDLPLLELESFLMYEVIQAHNRGKTPSNVNPFSKVHILPMLPLNRSAMRQQLVQRLRNELQELLDDYTPNDDMSDAVMVDIEPDALDYILDHGMEWQTWIHKKTNQQILEFCPQGAKALDPLMARISSDGQLVARRNRVTTPTIIVEDTKNKSIRRLKLVDDFGKFQVVTCTAERDDDSCTMNFQFAL